MYCWEVSTSFLLWNTSKVLYALAQYLLYTLVNALTASVLQSEEVSAVSIKMTSRSRITGYPWKPLVVDWLMKNIYFKPQSYVAQICRHCLQGRNSSRLYWCCILIHMCGYCLENCKRCLMWKPTTAGPACLWYSWPWTVITCTDAHIHTPHPKTQFWSFLHWLKRLERARDRQQQHLQIIEGKE